MAKAKAAVYATISYAGRCENLRAETFLEALTEIWQRVATSGSGGNQPKALLRNGVIVIEANITDVAYDHHRVTLEEFEAARARIAERCTQSFAAEYAEQ